MPAASRRARIACHFAGAPMSQLRRVAHRATLRRGLIVAVVATVALALGALGGLASGPTASAASAPAATQCNPPAYPTGAGFQVTCTFTIDNTVTRTGATSSTITGTACLAAAGVLPPFGCTTTVSTSNQLVTSVNQCNGITYGGGSNVTCKVAVVNTVVAGTSTPGVSVNQCIGSGTGGGTAPTEVCSPVAATTGATVTQCNGSGNGGGAMDRVQCTVTGGATALPVTVTQCDGSSNGGGSTVTCTTAFTNTFEAATPTTTTAPATPAGIAVGDCVIGSGWNQESWCRGRQRLGGDRQNRRITGCRRIDRKQWVGSGDCDRRPPGRLGRDRVGRGIALEQ